MGHINGAQAGLHLVGNDKTFKWLFRIQKKPFYTQNECSAFLPPPLTFFIQSKKQNT